MNKLATIATVYNRKESTLRCLESLIHACNLARFEAAHFIVDDNSSDGTSEAIKKCFPFVNIFHSNGGLYWAGGMRYGFEKIKDKFDYQFLIAYNDDCIFSPNSIINLVSGFEQSFGRVGIVVGSLLDPTTRCISYGGRVLRWKSYWLPPSFILAMPAAANYIEVDSLNMNLCCIRSDLIRCIGFLENHYTHSVADYDFGLRAKKAGYKILLAPSTMGYCSVNSPLGTSKEKGLSVYARVKRIFSIKECPLPSMIRYYKSHGGVLWPIWLIIFYISRFL